ncbi:MAG: tRNA pseudouridine(54/55) synthase Pus10 [Planctomycetes bacterium]|nr:tRNA pseudouridine(54/55) synthase Pus10 [Planctomycetota bacterium]
MTRTSPLPDPAALGPLVAERARAAAEDLEFDTFLVGVRARRLGKHVPESALLAWKGAVKRAAGGLLADAWPARQVAFVRPEVLFVWDADRAAVETTIRPVHLYGRYVKRARGVSQTRATWPCPACRERRPRGCAACEGTGLAYPRSVEGLLADPCAAAFRGDAVRSHLHGMGREDVDVLCLGAGRPFVLEVAAPRRRAADLAALVAEVEAGAAGAVSLPAGLRVVDDAVVARVKGWPAAKLYRAVARVEGPVDPARLADLPARLSGVTLAQRTPRRVARRRTDLVRARRVRALEVLSTTVADDGPGVAVRVELRIEAEAGTYIKELVSGDDGRTTPSVADALGAPCTCVELDVLDVGARDEDVLGGAPPPAAQAGDEGD